MRRNGIKRGKKNCEGVEPSPTHPPATSEAPLGGCHYVQVWVAKGEVEGCKGTMATPLFFFTTSHKQTMETR